MPSDRPVVTFGDLVRIMRMHSNMTQVELGKRIRKSNSFVRLVEDSVIAVSLHDADKLCRELGLKLAVVEDKGGVTTFSTKENAVYKAARVCGYCPNDHAERDYQVDAISEHIMVDYEPVRVLRAAHHVVTNNLRYGNVVEIQPSRFKLKAYRNDNGRRRGFRIANPKELMEMFP